MAVNIYEQPIKSAVDLEDAVTVYVPGYANFGPAEPTLCTSESEFEGLFGSTPYFFEEDQPQSEIAKGSPEKGYLYAKSLLASGLNVLFHRYKSPDAKIAEGELTISYGETEKIKSLENYKIVAKAISFGRGYKDTKVVLEKKQGNLYRLTIYSQDGGKAYSDVVSLDPTSSLYIKTISLPLIEFKVKKGDSYGEIEDSIMEIIVSSKYHNITYSGVAVEDDTCEALELTFADDSSPEFYVDDIFYGASDTLPEGVKVGDVKTKGLISSLADSSSAGLMYPLADFERYPSVTYLTSGGYYIDSGAAGNMLAMAEKIKAIALIDLKHGYEVNDQTTWNTFQNALASITGSSIAKGKGAAFIGCNSFDLSPYRIILGESFNYLKCLGENMKKGIAAWIPVANDPNGVSPLGYDSTDKINTELSETIAESTIGVQANPLIYSYSAGGYKIMGNRTLLSNDGVLSPNSFLNVSVVVNRVERACRQTANKLKIVSTSPSDTFQKFKNSVAKTLDPMVVSQDGLLSYKIKHLPKTKPATIDIQIVLVVVEGIETFNIYIPYSISLD